MKPLIYTKTLIALAVAIAAAAANVTQAQEQPIPPPSTATALPDGIVPGTPLEQVFKLVQAGIEPMVIKNYIANVQIPFNLDAGKIVTLSDAGVPVDVINAMMAHDQNLSSSATPPPTATLSPSAPPVSVSDAPETAPPPVPVTVNDFNNQLTPYGNWVELEGYGRCWRPTVVAYDSGWRPYCDRGHWVYSDHGWYWDSDYSWGVTFHYGRWFQHPRMGWVWWPDTVWGPSWVTWRSSDDYCGWAPLPPHTLYRPGFGMVYRGENVSVNFSFGLGADCYTFVSIGRLAERQPRFYRESHERVAQIFQQTTIINNYNGHQQNVVNHGIPVERVNAVAHRPIQAVAVTALPNATRHGWREESVHSANFSSPHPAPNPYSSAPSHPGNEPTHREPMQTPTARPAQSPSPSAAPGHWQSERHETASPALHSSVPGNFPQSRPVPSAQLAPSPGGLPQTHSVQSPQPVSASTGATAFQTQPRHETPVTGSGERRIPGQINYNYHPQAVVQEQTPVQVPRQYPQPVVAEAPGHRQNAGQSAPQTYAAPAAANQRSTAAQPLQPKPAYDLQSKSKDQNKDARNY